MKRSKRTVTCLQPCVFLEICDFPLQELPHSQGTESSALALNTIGETVFNKEKDNCKERTTKLVFSQVRFSCEFAYPDQIWPIINEQVYADKLNVSVEYMGLKASGILFTFL